MLYSVYILTDDTSGAVKVGLAKCLQRRLGNYKTHNPHGVTLVSKRGFQTRSEAARAESFILRRIKPHCMYGEWHYPEALGLALDILVLAPSQVSYGFHVE